jgi:hypothetical protein
VTSSAPPTFNIIYVPGTARALFDFARSLAEHSSYRFRLVSNACSPREEAFLSEGAAAVPGLEFRSLETGTVLAHGEALQRLFRAESAGTFAFMDSDIFARGAFLADSASWLEQHAAIFSGLPSWQSREERVMPDGFAYMSGRFSETASGVCLGASYCAIYRRADVERVMARTGATFHRRKWGALSREQRALLVEMGLAKRSYDTAKHLNLMLLQGGLSLAMREDPNLVHVGALSNAALRPSSVWQRIRARLAELVESSWPGVPGRRRAFERRTALATFARRRVAEDYFRHLLAGGAVDGGPLDGLPRGVRAQLVETGRELLALRRRYEEAGRRE